MIYYLIIVLLFIYSLKYEGKRDSLKTNYNKSSVFIFIILIFIGGFRYQVGADWGPYSIGYSELIDWSSVWLSRKEKLFCISVLLSNKVHLSFDLFIAIFFIVAFTIKYKIWRKYSPNIFVSLLIYFYTVFMIYDINGIRQGMALSLTLLSIPFICKRKLLPFLALCIVSIGFHSSSLFFIPAYWLYNWRISVSKYKALFYIGLLIVVAVPLRLLIQNYTTTFLAADDLLNHYSTYMDSDYNVGGPVLSFGAIQRLIIFFIYIYSLGKTANHNTEFELFLAKSYLIGIIIFVLFSFAMEYAARLSFCYKILETLMVPIALSKIAKDKKLIVFSIIFVFAIFSIYQFLNLPHQGYLLPYRNQIINIFI